MRYLKLVKMSVERLISL